MAYSVVVDRGIFLGLLLSLKFFRQSLYRYIYVTMYSAFRDNMRKLDLHIGKISDGPHLSTQNSTNAN